MITNKVDKIRQIAKSIKLPLSEEELIRYSEGLDSVVDWFSNISAVDTEGIAPMVYGSPLLSSHWRDDVVDVKNSRDELLINAKSEHGCFVVPRVVES